MGEHERARKKIKITIRKKNIHINLLYTTIIIHETQKFLSANQFILINFERIIHHSTFYLIYKERRRKKKGIMI